MVVITDMVYLLIRVIEDIIKRVIVQHIMIVKHADVQHGEHGVLGQQEAV